MDFKLQQGLFPISRQYISNEYTINTGVVSEIGIAKRINKNEDYAWREEAAPETIWIKGQAQKTDLQHEFHIETATFCRNGNILYVS